jgi:hypothetical protein
MGFGTAGKQLTGARCVSPVLKDGVFLRPDIAQIELLRKELSVCRSE